MHVEEWQKKMKIISVIINETRNRIDEFTDLNLNIIRFCNTFWNYFIDVFNILNVLNFKLHSLKLSDIQIMNNDDVHTAAVTKNSESATDIIELTATSVLDDVKMTSVK